MHELDAFLYRVAWATTIALSSASLVGCITGAGAVAKPTALEYQLLGAYEQLDLDLAHASSLRAAEGLSSSFDKLRAEALHARALQRFNEDDVSELKAGGCLAEGLDGRLASRPCAFLKEDPAAARRRTRVVREENASRGAILTWAAFELARKSGRPTPTSKDLAEIQAAYVRLLRDTAKPEHLIETRRGVFARRSELR